MEPGKLTEANDPVQIELIKKYGYEMPNLGISHDDALKIISFLKGADGARGLPAAGPAEPEKTNITPELVARGKPFLQVRHPSPGEAHPARPVTPSAHQA